MGDVIVGCNDTDMDGMDYDEAIKVLKGLPNTATIKYIKKSGNTPNIKKRKRQTNGSTKVNFNFYCNQLYSQIETLKFMINI